MKTLLLLAGTGLLVTGCFSSQRTIPVQYFTIDTNPEFGAVPSTLPQTLWIQDFRAAQRYGYEILFRRDQYTVLYKELERWVERPEEMATRLFTNVATKSAAFSEIVGGMTRKPTDYMLDGYILEFDEVRRPEGRTARLAIRLTLYRTRERSTVWTGVVTAETTLDGASSQSLAVAMSAAALQVAEQAIGQITAAVRKDVGG